MYNTYEVGFKHGQNGSMSREVKIREETSTENLEVLFIFFKI